MAKLFESVRSKLWIAAGCLAVLVIGALTLPAPAPTAVQVPQERTAPLLEAEVERRQHWRVFEDVQQLAPRLARHSVTLPSLAPVELLPSDVMPPAPRVQPAGHGLIVSADAEVLTVAGALRGGETPDVVLMDGAKVRADVLAFDPGSDLVLLRAAQITRTDAAPWASTSPTAGMLGLAVSHVGGQVAVAPVFVTAAPDARERVRITSADLLPGTPLYTTSGEVFAIAIGGSDGSAALVAPAVSHLRERIASGHARSGALGLTFQPIDEALQKVFATPGVLVADVAPHGPADAAGVRPGDIIDAIADTAVNTPDEARQAIAALVPGSSLTVRVHRDGKPLTIQMTCASALELRVRHGRVAEDNGLTARLLFDAPAREAAGLLSDSRILAINGTRVETADEARRVLRRARAPLVLYAEDARGRFFRVMERPR